MSEEARLVLAVLESDLPRKGAILALMALGLGGDEWKRVMRELAAA